MKLKQLLKEIKGVFLPPKKEYYIGKIQYGTPYFAPINYCGSIVYIRKLKLISKEVIEKASNVWEVERLKKEPYSNLPIFRRSWNKIVKLFGNRYYIEWGLPIKFGFVDLGWKDKYNTPRFEWAPMFYFYFFNWQFIISWCAPDRDNDKYYEMILSYLYYNNKDIKETKDNWGWVDYETKKSTWNDEFLTEQTKLKLNEDS